MIIKDTITGEEIDTAKLSDADALLMEKVEELTILCQRYGYRSALMIEQKSSNTFWSRFTWRGTNDLIKMREAFIKLTSQERL